MSHPVVGTVMVPISVVSVINRRGTEAWSDPPNYAHKSLICEGETVPVLGENTDLRAILVPFGEEIRTFHQKCTHFLPENNRLWIEDRRKALILPFLGRWKRKLPFSGFATSAEQVTTTHISALSLDTPLFPLA